MPLRRWTYTMSATAYSGDDDSAETSNTVSKAADADPVDAQDDLIEILVDETLPIAGEDPPLLAVMRRARADWAALTWVCWAAGLDHVALPDDIVPPATFGQAAVMIMERTWRCHDKLNSTGLLALTKGIPGFEWAGTAIDLVPGVLAEVALDEYVEARAIFAWLCDGQNQSPWQDDLRQLP